MTAIARRIEAFHPTHQAPESRRPPLLESWIAPSMGERVSVHTSDALTAVLRDLGVTHGFGVLGGAIVPFADTMADRIPFFHFRHEGGAAFAATELSLVTGKPVAVLATTGPGLTNCITGLIAARWEGAKVILLSGATAPAQRGRIAFQETSRYTGLDVAMGDALFDYNVTLEHPSELETVARRLRNGFSRPGGFVAHVSLPLGVQKAPLECSVSLSGSSSHPPSCSEDVVDDCVRRLASGPFLVWLGHGATNAASEIREFVERTGARVISSPRAKGIFPESHPLHLGVSGLGGHEDLAEKVAQLAPEHVLVLGTRLGESTSFWRPEFVPSAAFLHVDVNAEVFGVAYPNAKTIGITAEVKQFMKALLTKTRRWGHSISIARRRPTTPADLRDIGAVRPSVLMQAIQKTVVEKTDAVVISEAGTSFLWATNKLVFDAPNRYRVSSGFGSMGHATGGVVGAAMGRGRAFAIVGDGAMLMQSEISTAVQYGIRATWVVLNDSRYSMVDQGMSGHGYAPLETEFATTDFVKIAEAMGAKGIRVNTEVELEAALQAACDSLGPIVIDVQIDRTELAPLGGRNDTLTAQVDTSGRKNQ